MTQTLPPNPSDFRTMEEWASELYEFFASQSRVDERNNPLPVLLAHRQGGVVERATTEGILLYDPSIQRVVVSKDGDFVKLLIEDDLP